MFRYIGGGFTPSNVKSCHLYINYEKNPDRIDYDYIEEEGYTIVKCPDRTLALCRPNSKYRPTEAIWDEYITFDPFKHNSAGEGFIDWILMSAHNAMLEKEGKDVDYYESKIQILFDCLVGDTHVFTSKGMFEIKDLIFNKELNKRKDDFLCGTSTKNLLIDTQKGLKLATKIFKTDKRTVLRMETKSGYSITGSLNEKIKTRESGYVKLRNLKAGEEVAVIYGQNVWPKEAVEFNFDYEEIIKNKYIDYPNKINCKICNKQFKKLDSHVYFKHGLTASQYKEKYNVDYTTNRETTIENALGVKEDKYFDYIVPKKMTNKLARLLGYLIGDGRLKKDAHFAVHCGIDKDYAEDVLTCIKSVFPTIEAEIEFGKTDTKGNVKGTGIAIYTVQIQWSGKIMTFLEYIGCPAVNAREKTIPWCILQSNKKMVVEFLKGLFEADGSAQIQLKLHSIKLLKQVRSLLTNIGIISIFKEYKRTYIPMRNVTINKPNGYISITRQENRKIFQKEIGFIGERKRNILKTNCIAKYKSHKKVNDNYGDGIFWDKVIKVRKEKEKQVTYDFTIKEVHSFIANGIWCHNSGGAQLKIGTANYVDPKKIIDFYNSMKLPTSVFGACLDAPPRPIDQGHPDIIKASAHLQNINNNLFKERHEGSSRLLNVMHGFTLDYNRQWLDTVDDSYFHGWAAGGDNLMSDYNNLQTIMVPMLERKEHSNEIYHMFGLSGNTRIPLLAWLGKHVPLFTSDSSTTIQNGMRRIMLWMTPEYKLIKLNYGSKSPENPMAQLPCRCPVCRRLKYKDLFNLPTKTRVIRYIFWHNLWMVNMYSKVWVHFAETLSRKEYKKMIKFAYGKEGVYDMLVNNIDFVSYAFKNGLDSVQKRFSMQLSNDPYKSGVLPKLFEDHMSDTAEKGFDSSMSTLGQRDSIVHDVLPFYFKEEELIALLPDKKDMMYKKCNGCGKRVYRGKFGKTKVGRRNVLRCIDCRSKGRGRRPKV